VDAAGQHRRGDGGNGPENWPWTGHVAQSAPHAGAMDAAASFRGDKGHDSQSQQRIERAEWGGEHGVV